MQNLFRTEGQNKRNTSPKNSYIWQKIASFECQFTGWRSIACQLLCWFLGNWEHINLFSIFNSWHKHVQPHPNKKSNGRTSSWKNRYIFPKKLLLKIHLHDERNLYVNCLLIFFLIYDKHIRFQSIAGIRRYCPIGEGSQNGCISSWKKCHIWLILASFEG